MYCAKRMNYNKRKMLKMVTAFGARLGHAIGTRLGRVYGARLGRVGEAELGLAPGVDFGRAFRSHSSFQFSAKFAAAVGFASILVVAMPGILQTGSAWAGRLDDLDLTQPLPETTIDRGNAPPAQVVSPQDLRSGKIPLRPPASGAAGSSTGGNAAAGASSSTASNSAAGNRSTGATSAAQKQTKKKDLGPVLAPQKFFGKAKLGYLAAKQIPQIADKLFCYCGCDLTDEHISLLECFTSDHGADCDVCVGEIVDALKLHRKGATIAQIQEAIDKKYRHEYPFDETPSDTLKQYEANRLWKPAKSSTSPAKGGAGAVKKSATTGTTRVVKKDATAQGTKKGSCCGKDKHKR